MKQVKTYFKKKTNRDPTFVQFIRSQGCLIHGTPAECHHEPLNGHGMGLKGSDRESLPLCRKCHVERHQIGRTTFYEKHGIDWRYEVELYQKLYAADRAAKGE